MQTDPPVGNAELGAESDVYDCLVIFGKQISIEFRFSLNLLLKQLGIRR